VTTSGTEPLRQAITGVPADMASIITSGARHLAQDGVRAIVPPQQPLHARLMIFPVYRAQAVFIRDNHHAAGGRIDAFERELKGHRDRPENGVDKYGQDKDEYLALFGRDRRSDAYDDDVRKPLDATAWPI
jgi:hypothetical protein